MLFSGLCIFLAVATLIYSIMIDERSLLLPALVGIIFGIVLLIIFRIVSSSARCSLCAGAVLLSTRAQRNRNAKKLFGSYRFRVARDIALTGTYRCPYCGENTLCIAKDRSRHQ